MAPKRRQESEPQAEGQEDQSPDIRTGLQREDPLKEHQFKPGESGNPHGQPKHRTHLWTYFTRYMGMTDGQLARLNRDKLTQAQQTALGLVKRVKAGEKVGSTRMARYIVDREEGKAVEHLILDNGADLSDEECDELRKLIQGKHAGDGRDTE